MGKDQELIEAARNGDYQIVEKILAQRAKKSGPLASLRRGAGVNVQDSSGFSALHHAAVNRHRDIVELLLSQEASTNIVDLQGSSPLHLAAWSGNEDIVWLLLTHGPSTPNVNLLNQSLDTALHMASQFGHVGVVKLLLEHGANPVITNSRQETSLDLAAQYGRLETVQLLVNSHPELLSTYSSSLGNPRHVFPHTPLHLASRNGHRSVVDVLVKAGFDVNTRTGEGTALHEAALCGKVDDVKALLDADIDVCVTDSARRTAVDRLSEVGLKTPVAKEIAELIRGALKRSTIQTNSGSYTSVSSPLTNVAITPPPPAQVSKEGNGKLPLSQIYDNHSNSDIEQSSCNSSSKCRHTYSPRQSPKSNIYFIRDKTRRSLDVYLSKGPDFDKSHSGPPKKPPRRNLSASPTHPDFYGVEATVSAIYPSLSRNKSLDESVYRDTWRNSVGPCETTSQSTNSIDMSPGESCPPYLKASERDNPIVQINDIPNSRNSKSEVIPRTSEDSRSDSALQSGHSFVSVARINLRDSKTEQNLSPGKLRLKDVKDGDVDLSDGSAHASDSSYETPKLTDLSGKPVLRQKPSIAPKPTLIPPKPQIAPKPKNIKRLGHSYDNALEEDKPKELVTPRRSAQKSTSMSVLSPTDLDKEWEGIATFINALNSKNDSDGEERKCPLLQSELARWLTTFSMDTYESLLVANGFEDLNFLGENMLDEASLLEIGMLNAQHRKTLAEQCLRLPVRWPRDLSAKGIPNSVRKWLQELHLAQYWPTFEKNLYLQPERLLSLWNEELTTVLEIEALGHRRRLLTAAAKLTGNKVQLRNSNRVKNDEETDGRLSLREPRDLVSGVSSALKTVWRHSPETLINGSVAYRATYVGSCFVQEFSTTDSIQRAICEIRAQELYNLSSSAGSSGNSSPRASVHNTCVTLIVSASVISWYNAKSKSLVSEHEVGTIQCTCQASDDLRHLALVTRDTNSACHFCHVFCLDSVEVATEAILTLGQAFEVAYQLALSIRKDGTSSHRHIRSKSANQLCSTISIPETNSRSTFCSENDSFLPAVQSNRQQNHRRHLQVHARSHSVADLPPNPPQISSISKPLSKSPYIQVKDQKLPRAESFSFITQTVETHQLYSRAPIVSKEEL